MYNSFVIQSDPKKTPNLTTIKNNDSESMSDIG